jgi:hypothetical protein
MIVSDRIAQLTSCILNKHLSTLTKHDSSETWIANTHCAISRFQLHHATAPEAVTSYTLVQDSVVLDIVPLLHEKLRVSAGVPLCKDALVLLMYLHHQSVNRPERLKNLCQILQCCQPGKSDILIASQ